MFSDEFQQWMYYICIAKSKVTTDLKIDQKSIPSILVTENSSIRLGDRKERTVFYNVLQNVIPFR